MVHFVKYATTVDSAKEMLIYLALIDNCEFSWCMINQLTHLLLWQNTTNLSNMMYILMPSAYPVALNVIFTTIHLTFVHVTIAAQL